MKNKIAPIVFFLLMAGFVAIFYRHRGQDLLEGGAWLIRLSLELGALALVLLSAYGCGRFLFQLIFQREPSAGIDHLQVMGFGLIILSYFSFGLAAVHLLKWQVILPMLLIFGTAGFWSLPKFSLAPSRKFSVPDYLALFAVAAILAIGLFQALGPPIRWDDQVYHLVLPKLYLSRAGFYRVPFNMCAAFPQNLEMIYALALSVSSPIAGVLIHYSIGIMVLLTLFQLGKIIFGTKAAGLWAMAFFSLAGIFPRQASSAYIELGICLMTLLSLASLLNFRGTQSWQSLVATGIFAGGALGIKYLALGAVVADAILVLAWCKKQRILKTILFLAIAFCFLVPWLIKNQALMSNPVYPFFIEIFGSSEGDRTLLARYVHGQMMIGMGRHWQDYLLLFPRLLLLGLEGTLWFDAKFNPLLLPFSLISFLFFKVRKNFWLWTWFLIVFIIWASGPQAGRFLLPGIAGLSLISGAAFSELRNKLGKFLGPALALLVLGLSCWTIPRPDLAVKDKFKYAVGQLSLEQYLLKSSRQLELLKIDELLEVRRLTPPDTKIFLLWENRVLYLDRESLADTVYEASETKHLIASLGSPEKFYQWLKQNQVDYIYNGGSGDWGKLEFLLPETREEFIKAQKIYEEFVPLHGKIIFEKDGQLIKIE